MWSLHALPAGVDGNNAAATVAANMLLTFTGLRFGLMVGIGGGIPNLEKDVDIRLGDVVISQPDKTHGGVVQFDKGQSLERCLFERKGSLNRPPPLLLTALASLQAQHEMHNSQISVYLEHMLEQYPRMEETGYTFPGVKQPNVRNDRGESLARVLSHAQLVVPASIRQARLMAGGKRSNL